MRRYVQKVLKKAVIKKPEGLISTSRMQYGFQERIKITQDSIEFVARLEQEQGLIATVIDLEQSLI